MRTKKAICILHFQPLEKYPPVMNMLNFLAANASETIYVVSRKNSNPEVLANYAAHKNIKIIRTGWFKDAGVLRLVNYALFYMQACMLLLKRRPAVVLYYETLSAWPALWYKKLKGTKVKLLAHYHEYNTQHEFHNSMKLMKWQHQLETKMYATAYDWISHTNEVRLGKFITDHHLQNVAENIFRQMPNYPGKNWLSKESKAFGKGIIKLVYVGSLGYENMYIKEIVAFVQKHPQRFSLDLYSYNIHEEVKKMLEQLEVANIRYHGGCNYAELPQILSNYDVGLVIYKSYSENWINAVSNKVFEYLACGLDVWFSTDMLYTFKYVSENNYPKVLAIDYAILDSFDFEKALNRTPLTYKEPDYFYEKVYPEIYAVMKEEHA